MADQISKTGKRGGYSSSSVNISRGINNDWLVSRSPKADELTKIDAQRNKINKELNARRKELIDEVKRRDPKATTKEATQITDFQVYGTAKRKPRAFVFSSEGQSRLNRAKELYTERKPLDQRSKELRAQEDKSFRHLYDTLRAAKSQHRESIAINEEYVKLTQIREIQSNGRTTPIGVGKNVIGFQINGKSLKVQGGNQATVQVSLVKRPVIASQKTSIKGKQPPASNKVIFTYENGEWVTNTNMATLFNNARKKTGTALIYLNNKDFFPDDFFQGADGRWRISSYGLGELNAPEIEGTISVRYSYQYNPVFKILETTLKKGIEKAPIKSFGEINSTITMDGTSSNVTAIVYSLEALVAIKQARRLRIAGGEVSFATINFTIEKNGSAYIIAINGGKVKSNAELGEYTSTDEYLILSFVQDKGNGVWQWVFAVKSPKFSFTGFGDSNQIGS